MVPPESPEDLPRLITRIERRDPSVFPQLERMYDRGDRPPVLGVTGPPGVGKSSLVDRLIRRMREHKMRVAVVTVDPTSPVTGGALLGDRVRMQDHGEDPGVFIRSMSSRGHPGGLNSAIYDVVVALGGAGFDRILLETVGVGQGEIEVFRCSDYALVVLVNAYGDSVQLLKAGLQEIADCFVLNKIDRYPADPLQAELESLHTGPEPLRVFPVSAVSGEGLGDLFTHLEDELPARAVDPEKRRQSRRRHLESLLRETIERRLRQSPVELPSSPDNPYRRYQALIERGWDLDSRAEPDDRRDDRGHPGN